MAGILVSIPGVGKLTANLMAIDLPELGSPRRQADRVAGRCGAAFRRAREVSRPGVHPGRPARVRAKLYMAAFNARKYNPVIGEFYARLVVQGKAFKQAMTACMRKLLVLMNTLVARGELWEPRTPPDSRPGPYFAWSGEAFRPEAPGLRLLPQLTHNRRTVGLTA